MQKAFDLGRADLRNCLKDYVMEENRGGRKYEFYDVTTGEIVSATDALASYNRTGRMPRTKWQVHLFRIRKQA